MLYWEGSASSVWVQSEQCCDQVAISTCSKGGGWCSRHLPTYHDTAGSQVSPQDASAPPRSSNLWVSFSPHRPGQVQAPGRGANPTGKRRNSQRVKKTRVSWEQNPEKHLFQIKDDLLSACYSFIGQTRIKCPLHASHGGAP